MLIWQKSRKKQLNIGMREDIIQKLLEGIRKYGLENVSTLSKWIDIPVETARYMIWEELPKHYIGVGVSINLPRIGLGRWSLEIKPSRKSFANVLESSIQEGSGVMYLARTMPENTSFAFLGIPFGEVFKLEEELRHLKKSNVIESYTLQELEWMRYLSFNPRFYDFKARTWSFNWSDVEKAKEPLLTPYNSKEEEGSPAVDYKDILILKELRQKVPRTLSKLSDTLGLDQHNLRYHYKNHARHAIQGYYLKLLGDSSGELGASFNFMFEPKSESSLSEARAVALALPFTTYVWKTEKEYCWHVSCPGNYVNGVLRYVNKKFEDISGKLRLAMLDAQSEFVGAIPYQLFNESSGTWSYEPRFGTEILKK
jgi:DNA-binding Lrp family transcriptional regulator